MWILVFLFSIPVEADTVLLFEGFPVVSRSDISVITYYIDPPENQPFLGYSTVARQIDPRTKIQTNYHQNLNYFIPDPKTYHLWVMWQMGDRYLKWMMTRMEQGFFPLISPESTPPSSAEMPNDELYDVDEDDDFQLSGGRG